MTDELKDFTKLKKCKIELFNDHFENAKRCCN